MIRNQASRVAKSRHRLPASRVAWRSEFPPCPTVFTRRFRIVPNLPTYLPMFRDLVTRSAVLMRPLELIQPGDQVRRKRRVLELEHERPCVHAISQDLKASSKS
jgi:hypothetical protein